MSDLISRQAAIDALSHMCSEDENRIIVSRANVDSMLRYLPSADRPTGEWIRLEKEENVHDLHGVLTWGVNYMCDNCGFITTAIQDHFTQYRWCPSCGAKMEGEDDE